MIFPRRSGQSDYAAKAAVWDAREGVLIGLRCDRGHKPLEPRLSGPHDALLSQEFGCVSQQLV